MRKNRLAQEEQEERKRGIDTLAESNWQVDADNELFKRAIWARVEVNQKLEVDKKEAIEQEKALSNLLTLNVRPRKKLDMM